MIFAEDYSVHYNLDTLGYEHQTVNHSVYLLLKTAFTGFGDIWKADFKQMRGCCNIEIHVYYIWMKLCTTVDTIIFSCRT